MTSIPANCTWVDGVSPADVPSPRPDGRRDRKSRSREAILSACRASMRSGLFRPFRAGVARDSGVTERTLFAHFQTHEGMLIEALNDAETQRAILALVLRDSLPPQTEADRNRLLRAIVLGRA